MRHPVHRVRSFQIVGPYTLKVQFEDGVTQTINFEPVLKGELYGPLRDLDLFEKVQIDPEVHTLGWPNGADFDPATLYEWPRFADELATRAQQWVAASGKSQHSRR